LFKCPLISQWHGVLGSKLEEILHDRFDALLFAGLDLHCAVRGETPDFGSRNARVKAGAWGGLCARVCHQIEGHRLKMKEAKTAIIIPPFD
jgi:IS5 family transposase